MTTERESRDKVETAAKSSRKSDNENKEYNEQLLCSRTAQEKSSGVVELDEFWKTR